MDTCGRVLVAVALLVVTASAASAGGSLVGFRQVEITTAGLAPRVLRFSARQAWPAWVNADSVDHTLVFDGGSCTVIVPAGGQASNCVGKGSGIDIGPWLYAGTRTYRIRDTVTADGSIVIGSNERRVTLYAPRKTVRAGRALTLHGTVFAAAIGPLPGLNYPQRIALFRRVHGSTHFVLARRVVADRSWTVTIRPRRTATYVARALDPADKTIWEPAYSRRIAVRVAGSS
jgi:hypothetical protein